MTSMSFFTRICDKGPSPSFICQRLNTWNDLMKRDLSGTAKKFDYDCYLIYKQSLMIDRLMNICSDNQNNTNNYYFIRRMDCLLIKQWASVLTVYSMSNSALNQLPLAKSQHVQVSQRSNSSDRYISPDGECTSQKIEFMSESSLSLSKQENQTWNQTITLWYQIKQEIMTARNYIAPTVYPTKRAKKFKCCTII